MPKVIHFEINADDIGRAVHFYREAFSWEVEKWGAELEYWLAKMGADDQPGISGCYYVPFLIPRLRQLTPSRFLPSRSMLKRSETPVESS